MRIRTDDEGTLPLAALRKWIETWLPSRPLNLRVDESESASTPGTVTNKVPVYDENGLLIGYLPVYDDIA